MIESVSVVIPVYNNEKTIKELVHELLHVLPTVAHSHEIILVDDGSSDESYVAIAALATENERVRGIKFSRNFGQHPALTAGLEHATMKWTVIMDADMEDDPHSLVDVFTKGLDSDQTSLVLTEVLRGKQPRRSSRLFHWLFGVLNKAPNTHRVGTLRAFDEKVRRALLSYREQGIVYGPLMATLGFKTSVVGVQRRVVGGRESSYTWTKRFRLASNALLSNTALIGRAVLWLGVLFGVLTCGYVVFLLGESIAGDKNFPNGLSLVLLMICLVGSVTMVSLGLLSAYMMTILREVQGRPRYLIDEKIGFEH